MRLLSPTHRRIYPNPTSSNNGEGDVMTMEVLSKAGWQRYDGPAQTDNRGYTLPDGDPNVKPQKPMVR